MTHRKDQYESWRIFTDEKGVCMAAFKRTQTHSSVWVSNGSHAIENRFPLSPEHIVPQSHLAAMIHLRNGSTRDQDMMREAFAAMTAPKPEPVKTPEPQPEPVAPLLPNKPTFRQRLCSGFRRLWPK